jgi:hypothetical protein
VSGEALDYRAPEGREVALEERVIGAQPGADPAWIALTPTSPRQLPVDTGRLVALGHDHLKPTSGGYPRAVHDISAAASHIGGYRNSPGFPSLSHDLRLVCQSNRIDQAKRQREHPQLLSQTITGPDAAQTNEHWKSLAMESLNLGDHGLVLFSLSAKHLGPGLGANPGPVGWYGHHAQTVNEPELEACFTGRSSRPGKPPKVTEEGLKAHLVHRLTRVADSQGLVCFNSLLQTSGKRSAWCQTACALIERDNLALLHNIMLVAQ